MSQLEILQISSLTLLAVVFMVCVAGITWSSPQSGVPVLILVLGSFFIYALAWVAWWFLIYVQTVPIDRALAYFGIYSSSSPRWFGSLIILGPPVIPVLALIAVYIYRRRRLKAGS